MKKYINKRKIQVRDKEEHKERNEMKRSEE